MNRPVRRVWIYFKDKGQIESKNIEKIAQKHLSERSIARRANKSIPVRYDYTDLPVNQNYINDLRKLGINIMCISTKHTNIQNSTYYHSALRTERAQPARRSFASSK